MLICCFPDKRTSVFHNNPRGFSQWYQWPREFPLDRGSLAGTSVPVLHSCAASLLDHTFVYEKDFPMADGHSAAHFHVHQ